MLLTPGSHLSHSTKIPTRNTPEANSGTEVVAIENTEIVRSWAEPSFMPDSTPSSRASGTMNSRTPRPSRAVLPRRGSRISETGTLNRVDIPKSPTMKSPSQRA
jgi:hypothetical protein